jgi:hypothetical protein
MEYKREDADEGREIMQNDTEKSSQNHTNSVQGNER